jgi:hypothetical protein
MALFKPCPPAYFEVRLAIHFQRMGRTYRVVPGSRNWQVETLDLAGLFQCTLETRWLGVRKTCGMVSFIETTGLFWKKLAGWVLGSSVCA